MASRGHGVITPWLSVELLPQAGVSVPCVRTVVIHPIAKTREARNDRIPMKQNLATPSDASKRSNGRSAHGKASNDRPTNGKALQSSPSAGAYAPSVEAVALRAYLLYENHGAAHGHDVDDWLAAEAALRAEQGLAST